MSSPDLPIPIELTLHDVNEHDLVAAALASIQTRIPEWVPNEANIEVMLVEAVALLVGQSVYAINQLPRVTFDGLLQLYGVTRKRAVPAVGTVLVTTTTETGGWRQVPAGTVFRVQTDSGLSIDVVTTHPASSAGSLEIPVPVTVTVPGRVGNQITAGDPVTLVDSLSWVERVTVAGTFSGGADEESDAAFFTRAALFLRRQTLTLVLPDHFLAAAMEVDGVGRATVIDLWDAGSSTTPGAVPGHITVVVATLDGDAVTTETVNALSERLQSGALASLAIHIVPPAPTLVTLTVSVVVEDGHTDSEVVARVDQALRAWLSPARWPWGARLWPNEVIALVGNVPGVDRVDTVTSPQFGVNPPPTWLPHPLSLTITAAP